ncbi:MAG: hypothetical protein LBG52_07535 [Candidatus Peribacteria bacterium]|nr:hypothetical protein [Candidatus Peribacteria bacterium]
MFYLYLVDKMPRVRNTAYHYLLFLRDNNLLKMTDEGEYYVDLQLPVGLTPEDDLPIGINLGEVKQADGRPADGLLVSNKTLAGEILLTLSKEN